MYFLDTLKGNNGKILLLTFYMHCLGTYNLLAKPIKNYHETAVIVPGSF